MPAPSPFPAFPRGPDGNRTVRSPDDVRPGGRTDGVHGFIIWDLAKKSKAGRLGTAILFLGLCLFAFLAKPIITYIIEMARGIHG